MVGNPADLCLIRLQSDSTLPPDQRRGYKNVGDAMVKIVKADGILGLWRGCGPTVVRAMVLNVGMLAPYDYTKGLLKKYLGFQNERRTNMAASAVSGFMASFVSLPFDYMKTKMQKMKPLPDGTMPYKGQIDAFTKTIKSEGILGLWRGFPVFYARIAPPVMAILVINDVLKPYL